jgi:hypothetical protein
VPEAHPKAVIKTLPNFDYVSDSATRRWIEEARDDDATVLYQRLRGRPEGPRDQGLSYFFGKLTRLTTFFFPFKIKSLP